MTKRILITGGAGYLGSVLCEHALDAGLHVTVVDNLMYGQEPLLHLCADSRLEFVNGDVRNERLMRRLVSRCDIIIPLAAVVGAPACDRDPWLANAVNRDAVVMLNRLRSREQLVVYPMTNSGYGTKSSETLCTEKSPLEPVSLYGRSKAEAEKDLLASPNTITLRLATVFGTSPRMRLDLLVNHFTYAAVKDRYLVLFEEHCMRNFVHIRDVADGFLHAIAHADEMQGPYNVGLDEANMSKAELAGKIQQHVPEFVVHCSPIGEDPDKRNYVVSNERLRRTGFEARRSLNEGIRELIKGYRMLARGKFYNI